MVNVFDIPKDFTFDDTLVNEPAPVSKFEDKIFFATMAPSEPVASHKVETPVKAERTEPMKKTGDITISPTDLAALVAQAVESKLAEAKAQWQAEIKAKPAKAEKPKPVLKTPDAPATYKQGFMIWISTGVSTKDSGLTMSEASVLIDCLMQMGTKFDPSKASPEVNAIMAKYADCFAEWDGTIKQSKKAKKGRK